MTIVLYKALQYNGVRQLKKRAMYVQFSHFSKAFQKSMDFVEYILKNKQEVPRLKNTNVRTI